MINTLIHSSPDSPSMLPVIFIDSISQYSKVWFTILFFAFHIPVWPMTWIVLSCLAPCAIEFDTLILFPISDNLFSYNLLQVSSFGDPDITLKQLYMAFPHLPRCQPSLTTQILSIWQSILDRVFFHYKQASAAYFSFLRLGDNQVLCSFAVITWHIVYFYIRLLILHQRLKFSFTTSLYYCCDNYQQCHFNTFGKSVVNKLLPQLFLYLFST